MSLSQFGGDPIHFFNRLLRHLSLLRKDYQLFEGLFSSGASAEARTAVFADTSFVETFVFLGRYRYR